MSSAVRHTTRQRAAKDVSVQILARVLNLALGVFVTALLARALGSVGYGQWATNLVVLGLVGYMASFGMEKVVVREAAAAPENELEWFGAMMLLRLILLVPAIVTSLVAVLLLHRSHEMLVAGVILVLSMPFDGIGVVGLVFQLRISNLVPMLVLTLKSVLWGVAVLIVYLHGGDMIELAIALAVTNAIGSLAQTVLALRVVGRWPRPSPKRLRPLMRVGIPLGISGALIISYARVDQLIVYTISGSRPAGLYSAVYNVLDSSHFVPLSILTTLTPIIAASWPADRERMLRVARLAAELLTVASLGALAFAIAAAEPLVVLIFGVKFRSAAPALPVLGGAFVFICFGYLNGSLLTAMGLQGRLLRIGVLALIANVVGNLILVPQFSFMGAAWMTLMTEVIVFGCSLQVILRTLEKPFPHAGRIARTALAAALLLGGLLLLRYLGAPLGALALAACACYPALLLGLRALGPQDIRIVLRRQSVV